MTESIKVNFTDDEASSEGRSFEPVPTGEYACFITKCVPTKIKDQKADGSDNPNKGKFYWAVELTVNESNEKYGKRKFFPNLMLFDGALYLTSQLLKSLGYSVKPGEFKIPPANEVIGKELIAIVVRQQDAYAMKKDPDGGVLYKNEVKGMKSISGATSTGSAKSGGNSLLPG